MLTLLFSVILLTLSLAALAGWGGLTHRLCHGTGSTPWTYRAALGIATVAVAGGLLNYLHLAYPAALDTLFALGLLLEAWPAARWLRAWREAPGGWRADGWRARAADLTPRIVLGGTALFLAATLLPTGVFNHHDDMQKYMVPPLQMLATGTMGGNPLDTVGFYSLGIQPFFQGFILAHFPMVYINGFDTVLCFLLTGLLLDDMARRMGVAPVFRTLGALILVAINPQVVNVSSVYSGALAAAGMAWSGTLVVERVAGGGTALAARAAVPLGLFSALLTGLKLTHVPYGAVFLCVLLVLLVLVAGAWRPVAAAVGGFLGGVLLLAAPWIGTYRTSGILAPLLAALTLVWHRIARGVPAEVPKVTEGAGGAAGDTLGGGAPAIGPVITKIFSTSHIYFGQTPLAYAVVATGVAAACAVLAVWLVRHRRADPGAIRGPVAAALAAGIAAAAYFGAIPYTYPITQGIRYVSPLLAVAAVLALVAIARISTGSGTGGPKAQAVVIAACMGVMLGLFVRATADRAIEAIWLHTQLSFHLTPFHHRYHALAFGDEFRRGTRTAQAHVPPGAGIMAWIATPFYLDFGRNTIDTIPDPDFARRWLNMPFEKGPEALARFLRGQGITHVIWEYNGPGMRSDHSLANDIASGRHVERGRYTLMFKVLLAQMGRGRVLHDDGRLVVYALEGP